MSISYIPRIRYTYKYKHPNMFGGMNDMPSRKSPSSCSPSIPALLIGPASSNSPFSSDRAPTLPAASSAWAHHDLLTGIWSNMIVDFQWNHRCLFMFFVLNYKYHPVLRKVGAIFKKCSMFQARSITTGQHVSMCLISRCYRASWWDHQLTTPTSWASKLGSSDHSSIAHSHGNMVKATSKWQYMCIYIWQYVSRIF